MSAKVVDFHIHASNREHWGPNTWRLPESFNDTNDLWSVMDEKGVMHADKLERLLEASGVDYGVILPEISPLIDYHVSNDFAIEFCAGSQRLIPFANINPYLCSDPADELKRLVLDKGIRGLKLTPTYQHYYPNEGRFTGLYRRAQELRIPVMIHTGSSIFSSAKMKYGDPIYIEELAVEFPELILIMVHGGRGFWYEEAFFLAKHYKNVYIEISGLPPKRLLNYFPRLEDNADKFIFGSDWPGLPNLKLNVDAIKGLPISEEAKEKILGSNALRLLSLG